MRRAALLLALSTAATSGCAAFAMTRGPDPAAQLHDGVIALENRDYSRAQLLLAPLYREYRTDAVGQQAALALIAADLDTRNPSRSLWSAADRAAQLLNIEELQPWLVPVTESYYLLALELGAQEERLARADSAVAAAEQRAAALTSGRTLPEAPENTVPARLSRVRGERDALQRRLNTVETELETRDRELKETKAELERIKRTIKP